MEELLNALDDLKAKKAVLEKQEQEAAAALREKLREQRRRLGSYGITLDDPPAPRRKTNRH